MLLHQYRRVACDKRMRDRQSPLNLTIPLVYRQPMIAHEHVPGVETDHLSNTFRVGDVITRSRSSLAK